MKRILTFTLMLGILIFINACSGKTGTSKASFDVKLGGISSINSVAGGGAMLYGRNNLGDTFGMRLDTVAVDTLSLEIPNGSWNFNVVVWDGDHDSTNGTPAVPLTGKVRCGVSLGNELNGGEVNITLNISNAKCSDQVFSPETNTVGGNIEFPQFFPKTCRVDLSTVTDQNASECSGAGEGFFHSVRIFFVPFKSFGGAPLQEFMAEAIPGPCISKNTSAGNPNFTVLENINGVNAIYNIPGGKPGFADSNFRVVVRGFFGESADCDASDPRGFTNAPFSKGINFERPDVRVIAYNTGLNERAVLMGTPDNIACAPPRDLITTDFSTGGTKFYSRGICNADQFSLIPADWATAADLKAAKFTLLKDINYYEGIVLDPSSDPGVPDHPMIGTDFTGNEASEPNPYTGIFDGNGKKIVGIRIDQEDYSGVARDLGFVRSLGSGGTVKNLTLVLPEIWADSYEDHASIGIIAGSMNGGTIQDVSIIGGKVEGRVDIGLAVGKFDAGTIYNVDSTDSEVEGLIRVGGLVGVMGGGTITDSGFIGGVFQDGQNDGYCSVPGYFDPANCASPGGGSWNYSESFGGIVGDMTAGSLNGVRSIGAVIGAQKVGGLIGSVSGGTISDSYSLATVLGTSSSSANSDVGGLIGNDSIPGMTVTRAFHSLGSIMAPGVNVGPMHGSGIGTNYTNVFGTSTTSGTATYAQVRDGTFLGTNNMTSGAWIHDDPGYDFPRLAWEPVRYCSGKFEGTFAAGTGSAADPFQICNAAQMASIGPILDSTNHYKLMRPIDLMPLAQPDRAIIHKAADLTAVFGGNFDGNGMFINNVFFNNAGQDLVQQTGLFPVIGANGVFRNAQVIGGGTFLNTSQALPLGIAAGINAGLIERVTTFGLIGAASTNTNVAIGGIAGKNTGVIIGSGSNARVKGSSRVGGVAGQNLGGLIAYSRFGGKVGPYGADPVSKIGGITGWNNPNGGSKNYYDPVFDEVLVYDGTITDVAVQGDLIVSFDVSANDQTMMTYAGHLVGFNQGELYNIESYGRVDLTLGTYPTYKGTFDASTDTPTQTDGDIWVATVGSGGARNINGVNVTWNIGDAIWYHNGNAYHVPALDIDTTLLTIGSTQIAPWSQFGLGIGVNDTGAIVDSVYYNQNSDYNGAQYFGENFGGFVGVNNGDIDYSVFEGGFNYPGSNTDHIGALTTNYKIYRDSGTSYVMYEADTAQFDGTDVIQDNTLIDFTTDVTTSDPFALGSYSSNISSVTDALTMTPSGFSQAPPTGTSFPLFVVEDDISNYTDFFGTEMAWDVGDYDTGSTWRTHNGGTQAGLIRPESYSEMQDTQKYIELINSY